MIPKTPPATWITHRPLDSIVARPEEEQDQDQAEKTSHLAVLRQLEASLGCSHCALLALDLVRIEQETGEQIRLSRELASLHRRAEVQAAPSRIQADAISRSGDQGGGIDLAAGTYAAAAAEVRRSAKDVLQAGRVQAALLRRAQHHLLVLANTLAGSSINYGRLMKPGSSDRGLGGEARPLRLRCQV
jgi:hypothetical protein